MKGDDEEIDVEDDVCEHFQDQLAGAFIAGVGLGVALGALIVALGMWIL